MNFKNGDFKARSRVGNQPLMPWCFAAVEDCTHHIATVPSVRNAGGRESRALQVEPPRTGFFLLLPRSFS